MTDASSNRVRPRPDCPHCEGTGVIYHMSEFPDRCPCRDAIPNRVHKTSPSLKGGSESHGPRPGGEGAPGDATNIPQTPGHATPNRVPRIKQQIHDALRAALAAGVDPVELDEYVGSFLCDWVAENE